MSNLESSSDLSQPSPAVSPVSARAGHKLYRPEQSLHHPHHLHHPRHSTIYTSYCAGAGPLFLFCRIFTLKLDPLSEVILEGHNSQQEEGIDIM